MRCLLVDDSPEFLDAARSVLTGQGVDVVGTAGTTRKALDLIAELRPDVVLVDINLGTESGFAMARAVEATGPTRPPVILISTHAADDYEELIEASPALGFLSKSSISGAAIRALLDGHG